MGSHISQAHEFELADTRNQLARATLALQECRRESAALAKENALLRGSVVPKVAYDTVDRAYLDLEGRYFDLESAYRQLENRFVNQAEIALRSANDEIDELNAILHAVRSGKFWKIKGFLSRLRQRATR